MEDKLAELKRNICEDLYPMFSDDILFSALREAKGDVQSASYRLLIRKSENTTLGVSGLTMNDTSAYFLRLAARYRPSHTGFLGR